MARRAAMGESSIHRDAAGRWHGYVSLGRGEGGGRDRRHVSARTRGEVVARVREIERKRDASSVPTAGRAPTVEAWLTHWLDSIAAARVRPLTLAGYRSKVEIHLLPHLGHVRLDRLQPEHLEALYAQMLASGLSGATVLQTHRIFSRALKVALQRGRVSRNVATLVDSPSVDRIEVEPLSAAEARALLAAAEGLPNAARWSVALALGLRQGEALGLRWDAVDLDAGRLRVVLALQRQPGVGLVLVAPKSRASTRTLVLPGPLVAALRTHRAAQLQARLAAGSAWEDHDLVFVQPSGRPIDPSADWAAWKALLRSAGVRDARLHDARHTAATLLLVRRVASDATRGGFRRIA